jgi:hypothetical protein
MKKERVSMAEIFAGHQEVMAAELQRNLSAVSHPTAKGDLSEERWISMLSQHLPRRYAVTGGFVIDHRGSQSDQIDVVVHDSHFSPILRADKPATYIPAESVYAVFEVKQSLSVKSLRYAGKKAASVRRLERTSAVIPHAGGTFASKPLHRILAGVLTLRCEWPPGLSEKLPGALADLDVDSVLELGCCLEAGAWQWLADDPEESGTLKISEPDTALVSFFLALLDQLRPIASVPAIQYEKYGRDLWSSLWTRPRG